MCPVDGNMPLTGFAANLSNNYKGIFNPDSISFSALFLVICIWTFCFSVKSIPWLSQILTSSTTPMMKTRDEDKREQPNQTKPMTSLKTPLNQSGRPAQAPWHAHGHTTPAQTALLASRVVPLGVGGQPEVLMDGDFTIEAGVLVWAGFVLG